MLNPPEREQYVVGSIVKKLAKPLANLFEDSSEKAIENKMKAVHKAVEEAPAGTKRSDTFKQVAEKEDITVQDVKDIEKVFAYRAGGGGGNESILGETVQTLRAMTKKPTAGQQISEELGGTATTKAARKKAGKAILGTAGVTVPSTAALSYLAFSPAQESKVKENKTTTVTDITSGTMDSAFSKASKNPTKYVFMKSGQPHFKYKGKAVPFALATEEEDVVLDMTPRSKKDMGGEMESFETTRTREAAIEKDERERRERMIKAEAKRLGISEEKLKEIMLEREQAEMDRKMQEAAERQSRAPLLVGGQTELDANKDGDISAEDFAMLRDRKAHGSLMIPLEGMPVDTYPNIPEDEIDEALASQLPDEQMEDDYISYVMDESLSDSEQDYLAGVLQNDPRLSDILDKVITVASEFSGAGEVEGPGTGVSDSIPARLSDGEFVFTRKATDQIGADQLQTIMDDAERAYDGGYQMKAIGGYMQEDPEEQDSPLSQTDEEIKKLMMGANKMPSLQ